MCFPTNASAQAAPQTPAWGNNVELDIRESDFRPATPHTALSRISGFARVSQGRWAVPWAPAAPRPSSPRPVPAAFSRDLSALAWLSRP